MPGMRLRRSPGSAGIARGIRDDSPMRRRGTGDDDQVPIYHPAGGSAAYQIAADRVIVRVSGAETGGAYLCSIIADEPGQL